jgi:hydrogenase/urease accessory protein HupE
MKKWFILIAFLVFVLETSSTVYAHSYSVAFTKIDLFPSQTIVQYAINDISVIESIKGIDVNGDYTIDANELEQGQAKVAEWVDQNLVIQINGQRASLLGAQISLNKELPFKDEFKYRDNTVYEDYVIPDAKIVMATIKLDAVHPGDSITIEDRIHNSISAEYGNFINILNNGKLQNTTVLLENEWSYTFKMALTSSDNSDKPAHASVDWMRFLKLGSEHILTGLDHLLFLFTLILLRMRIKEYAKIITSFTIAHCLTLALSVLGIITLPSKFVESMIAVSIMYVALENLFFPKNARYRWSLTFLFGLIHGLGFADLLIKMNLPHPQLVQSLLSFNLGIEITQLTLVAIFFPFLWYWHKTRWYPSTFKVLNIFAVGIAFIWLIERILA